MMRLLYITTLFNLMVSVAVSAPPKLDIPSDIQASGDYVSFIPSTDAVSIAYVSMSGVEPFPSGMLRDQRAFLLPVRGLSEGRYTFVAIGIKDNEYTRVEFNILVGKVLPPGPGPNPPTPPTPPTPPEPKPDPKLDDAPVKTDGLYVLFIIESGQRVTQQQFNILYGLKVRSWLDTNCDSERIGNVNQPTYRLMDQNLLPSSEPWASALKRTHTSIPWVVIISRKKYVHEQRLDPNMTEDAFIDILKKHKPNAKIPELWKTLDCPDGNCPIAPQPRPKLVPMR